MNSGRLRSHLLREHCRSEPELDGLPLEDLHRFEHVEHEMGLITLSHGHAPDGSGQRLDHADR